MSRIKMITRLTPLLLALALWGCDERTPVTATPSPEPPVVNTLAPTPTLAETAPPEATETAGAETPPGETPPPGTTATAAPGTTPTIEGPVGVEERISFAPGAISATVENAVVSGTRDRYLVEAQAGQTMRVAVGAVEDNAEIQVLAPDGAQMAPTPGDEAGVWLFDLAQTGDYVIVVGPTRGNATYRLVVTIPPLGTPDPTRIEFEPGMAGAVLEGRVEVGERMLYVMEAVEDQYMTVGVVAEGGAVALGVQGADGTVFLPPDAEKTALTIVALPATMDYFIEVAALGAATDYSLDVSASPLADLPERISLEGGETTVSGTLEPGGDLASYIVALQAGQSLVVEALPPEAPLSVYLQSEDGADFFFAIEGRLEATAPRALDYVLTVSTPNAAGETEYELRIRSDS